MSEATNEANNAVILETENPYGSIVASLENDGRTIYLYLYPAHDNSFRPRALWVRNLVPAPEESDHTAMEEGLAPRLKQAACRHPGGLPSLAKEDLKLVWFPEGNGVSLYLNGDLEAILPPWSGQQGLFGYAKEALAEDVGTLPLPSPDSAPGLYDRLEENKSFWEARQDGKHWNHFRDSLLAHYESVFGRHTRYFAAQRSYPPLAIVEFKKADNDYIYATLGMSYQNMPGIELQFDDPENHVRAEILTRKDDCPDWMPGVMGRMGYFPWAEITHFAHGHSYESGLPEPMSDFLITSIYDESMIPRPGEFIVDGRYPVSFLYAMPVDQEVILETRIGGAKRVLDRILKEKGLL